MKQIDSKMNSDKTEFILFIVWFPKTSTILHDMDHINVCGDHVPKSDKIKLLGTWLDSNLNLKHHINLKCRTMQYLTYRNSNT